MCLRQHVEEQAGAQEGWGGGVEGGVGDLIR